MDLDGLDSFGDLDGEDLSDDVNFADDLGIKQSVANNTTADDGSSNKNFGSKFSFIHSTITKFSNQA